MEEKNTSITFDGREIRLTTGLYAPQAGGAVMIECGDTSLLDEFNAAKDPMERLEIHRKIQGLPRNSAPTRVRNRCWATGKPRGVYRDFGLCRNQLRLRAHNGELPGVVKSSW